MAPRGGGGEPGWVGGDAVCGRGGSGQRWGGLFQGFVLDRHAAADRAQPGDGLWQLRGHARRGAPLERGAHRCADRGREGCGARRHRGRADDVPEGERRQRQRARRCEQPGQQRADSQRLRGGQRGGGGEDRPSGAARLLQLHARGSQAAVLRLPHPEHGPDLDALRAARSFTASDSFEFGAGSPVLDLVAGDYTLMIDAPGDQTAPYAFHLFDLSQATAYTPGTVTDATLSPARETDVYRFEATAGERYYFDAQRFTGGDIFWRLVNPFGKLVFDRTSFANDVGIVTLELTGAYTLLIEGPVGMTGQTSYRFNAQRIADDVKPLVFGQAQGIEGRQWTAGQLGGGVYLDGAMYAEVAHSATINVVHNMTLEAWIKVDRFADGDAATPILYKGNPSSGQRTYALWVNQNGSVTFSTWDNYVGTTTLTSNVADLIRADEWHHVAAVVNRDGSVATLYVDGVDRGSVGVVYFRDSFSIDTPLLIGRNLETGFGNFEGTLDEVRLWNVARTGAQIAASKDAELVGTEAGLMMYLKANEGTGSVLADASNQGNSAQIRNVYGPGSAVVAGRIDHPGQRDFYSFTLAEAKQLYFDSLTQNTGLTWTLSGPRGAVVNARSFTASDSFEFGAGSPVLDLVAGDYTLMIDAPGDQTAPYAFHLFDLSQATAYTPGTVTDGVLSPARETDLYRFEATAGERYYFDAQRFTGGDIFWRLVNPFGKLVFDRTNFTSDVGIVTLELTGAYTLLIEGPVGMTGQTSYRFNAQRIADDVKPLVFGQAQGIEGRQWTAGQLGGGVYLDGAMYAEVAHSATINVVHNMTLEAWIKVDRFADGDAATPILYKGNPSSGQRTYALWVNQNGSVTFSTWDNYVGTTTLTSNVADLIRADEWHHVAAVVNRDGSVATLYVDGVDRGSVGVVYFVNSFSIDTPLLIGRNLESGFGNFEGTLDEVRLWNVARTGAQIAASKDAELVGTEAGLMM